MWSKNSFIKKYLSGCRIPLSQATLLLSNSVQLSDRLFTAAMGTESLSEHSSGGLVRPFCFEHNIVPFHWDHTDMTVIETPSSVCLSAYPSVCEYSVCLSVSSICVVRSFLCSFCFLMQVQRKLYFSLYQIKKWLYNCHEMRLVFNIRLTRYRNTYPLDISMDNCLQR